MRPKPFSASEQHSLIFARHDIWQSIPIEHRRECRDRCEQMLRAAIEAEQQSNNEVDHEREVSSGAP
jgi:hypothetical protein